MIRPRRTRSVARLRATILFTSLLVLPWLALALPVAACSCVAFEGFDAIADAEHVVVAGRVVARQGDVTTIQVDRWFWGSGGGPVLTVREASPETDMCALGPGAPPGEPWLWVAWAPPNERPVVNSCQPSWSLQDPEGAQRLREAIAVFGGTPVSPEPSPGSSPSPPSGIDGATVAAAAVSVLAGVAVLGSATLVGRRRRTD